MGRLPLAFLLLAACTFSVSAQTFSKYRGWGETPEAYFMTAAEREQWRGIVNDEKAEPFVNDFRAKRGGEDFVHEVRKRIENADKHLSIGRIKGSKTLGGKAVVLFGAPIKLAVKNRVEKRPYPTPKMTAVHLPPLRLRDFTFTFSGRDTPALNGEDFVVVIEADLGTGMTRTGKGMSQKDLDALFEAAAAASITKR